MAATEKRFQWNKGDKIENLFMPSLRIQPPLTRSRYYVRNARRLYSQANSCLANFKAKNWNTTTVTSIRVNRGRLVMKAGGLQRMNSLFWFMACHVTAKVHRLSKWRTASSFCSSFREFILVLRRQGKAVLAYLIEQNRTKIQSNSIEQLVFNWVRQSNKIEHLFCCEFDFRTNRTKSN